MQDPINFFSPQKQNNAISVVDNWWRTRMEIFKLQYIPQTLYNLVNIIIEYLWWWLKLILLLFSAEEAFVRFYNFFTERMIPPLFVQIWPSPSNCHVYFSEWNILKGNIFKDKFISSESLWVTIFLPKIATYFEQTFFLTNSFICCRYSMHNCVLLDFA